MFLECVLGGADCAFLGRVPLGDGGELSDFSWSSYGEYLKGPQAGVRWLRVDRLLGEHGIPKDSPAGRAAFERRMELRRAGEDGEEFKPILGAGRWAANNSARNCCADERPARGRALWG